MVLQEGPSIQTTTTLMVAGGPGAVVPPQVTFPPDFCSQVPVDTQTSAKVEHVQGIKRCKRGPLRRTHTTSAGKHVKEARKMMLQEGPSIRTTTTLMVAGGPRAVVPPQALTHS